MRAFCVQEPEAAQPQALQFVSTLAPARKDQIDCIRANQVQPQDCAYVTVRFSAERAKDPLNQSLLWLVQVGTFCVPHPT